MDSAKGIIKKTVNLIKPNPEKPNARLANQITGQMKIEKSIDSNVKDGSSASFEGNNVL